MVEQVKAMAGSNAGSQASDNGSAHGGREKLSPTILRLRDWLAPLLIAGLVLSGYFSALLAPQLLDEQFLRAFVNEAGHGAVPFGALFRFHGFDGADLWGPLTPIFLKASFAVCGGVLGLERFGGLVLHFGAALFLFNIVRRMQAGYWLSLASAVLFCLFPLSAEAVTWLGGRGSELSVFFFLASFWLYQKARGYSQTGSDIVVAGATARGGIDWICLAASLVLFLGSLTCSALMWVGALVVPCYELFNWLFKLDASAKSDLSNCMIGALPFVVLCGAYFAAGGLFALVSDPRACMHICFAAVAPTIKNMLFPINQAIWQGYAQQYRFLYFLLPPFLVALPFAAWRNRQFARLFGFAFLWFLLSLLPCAGHATQGTDLGGSRFLYFASAPFSLMMSLFFAGFYFGFKRWRAVTAAVSAVGLVLCAGFYFRHVSNQNGAYRVGGRVLAAVEKSVKIVVAKTGVPFVLVRDLPQFSAISPLFSTAGMVALDGTSGALACLSVPGGRLKDALKAGQYRQSALHWEKDFQSLIPLELTASCNTFPESLSAQDIVVRLVPRLELYKCASLDKETSCLVLESNSTAGPAIRLDAQGLSPIDGDFLYVDARIAAPPPAQKPLIELYWQTRGHEDYDNKERRTWTTAVVNDQQFHRYYLPLRSIGWTTNGTPSLITLGFPAGAKVFLKGMGVVDGRHLMPQFSLAGGRGSGESFRFVFPCFNFPICAQLGLGLVEDGDKGIAVSHNVEGIDGAAGVLLEFSATNKNFDNPNGNELCPSAGKKISFFSTRGTDTISCADFPGRGLYRVRAIAIDSAGHVIGNFSDDVVIQVP